MFYKGNEDREKRLRFSIRKVSFGAASVAVATLFMFSGNGAVYAAEPNVTATDSALAATPANNQLDENSGASEATAPKAQADTTTQTPADSSSTSVESAPASKVQDETPAPTPVDESVASVTPAPASVTEEVEEKATPDLDKKQLEDYVAEIDAKLASGSYATKTDESVATLKEYLELAKLALTTAKSQDELTKAYRRLFMTASSGLRNKPKAQVESPKLDTTEGKATVGKKASNTEKATGSNSIANSGQHDSRNGQALDRNNPFRTDGATTDTDPAANQVYKAPEDSANVDGLLTKLEELPSVINNETKLKNIDQVAAAKNIPQGTVKELDEFGGWKAVRDSEGRGKFVVVRKTADGVFPIETVNTVKQNLYTNRTWTSESVLDRGNEHVLLLSEVRTEATRNQDVFDKTTYIENNEGKGIARGLTGYNGIEKTFKAFSPTVGSTTKISFKTGYTGDIDGHKAKYRVEVLGRTDETSTPVSLYSVTFDPSRPQTTTDMKVIAAKDGNSSYIDTSRSNTSTETLNTKLAERGKSPNGTTGTFTSKDIEIPPGYTEYTVRISSADNTRLGMGYQVPWRHFALPVAGLEFSITQDTKQIAKSLLQKAYNKLLEDQQKDEHRKTEDSVRAYQEKLAKIKELLDSNELKNNSEYLSVLKSAVASRDDLVEQNFEAKIVKQVKDSQVLTDLSTHPEKVITYKENSVEKALPDDLVASWKNTPDFTTVGTHTGTVVISKKGDAGAQNPEIAEVTVPITIYPKAEAKQAKFVNVLTENNRLLDGDNPENYIKFVNGNQTVAKPEDMTVTWHEKPSTTTANADQEGIVKVSYSATDENGDLSTQSYFVPVKVPVYHATLNPATRTTTFGVNFTANDSRTITRTNYPDGSKIKSYWGSTNFYSSARNGSANYLGKRTDQVQVFYPNSNDQIDYVEARSEKLTATFVVKPVRPSLVSSLAKVGSNEVTVDNVNSGTTVVLYDVSNPDNPIELGSVAVPNEGNFDTKSGIKVPLNSGKMLAKGQQIAARTIYAPLDDAQRTESDFSETFLVPQADKAALEAAKAELDKGIQAAPDTSGKTPDSVTAYNQAKTEAETAAQEAQAVINNQNASEQAVQDAIAKVTKAKEALDQAKTNLTPAATEQDKQALTDAKNNLDTPATTTGMTPESIDAYNKAKDAAQTQVDEAKAEAQAALAKGANATQAEVAAAKAKVDAAQQALDAAKAKLVPQADKAALEAAKAELDKGIQAAPDTSGKTPDSVTAYNQAKTEAETAAQEAQAVINNQNASEQAVQDAIAKVTKAKEALDQAKTNLTPAATEQDKQALTKEQAKSEIDKAAAAKIQAIEGNAKLSEAEKSAAKEEAKKAADEAKKAIDAATTQAEVDRILRNDIYKDDAAINEVEAFDLSSLLVNGFVSVKQGETLTDQEVLSKVNLPKDVEVIKVEKPTTSALGRLVAKVTLKLSDGSVEEINVPVEVTAPQNHGNEGNGANNGATNTDAKVDKAKLEGAIHQLDELIIKESAKFDAETAKEANTLLSDAKKVFANADATQAEVDAMVKRIEDFMAKVAPSTDHANTANDQSAQTPAVVPANNQSAQTTVVAPATTQAAANASQTASAQANARKAAKELPNTGTADSTVAMVAAAASALLGLGLAGRRRKEDEEA